MRALVSPSAAVLLLPSPPGLAQPEEVLFPGRDHDRRKGLPRRHTSEGPGKVDHSAARGPGPDQPGQLFFRCPIRAHAPLMFSHPKTVKRRSGKAHIAFKTGPGSDPLPPIAPSRAAHLPVNLAACCTPYKEAPACPG
jgi:hypothetical protein